MMRRLGLLLLLAALPLAADDYLDGFEKDVDENGIPDGWSRYVDLRTHPVYNRISMATDPAHVREGKSSVRLATRGGSVAIQTEVPSPNLVKVDFRKGYTFSVWAMCEGLSTSRAFAETQWLDALGAPIGTPQRTNAIGGTTPWTPLVSRFDNVPEAAHFVRFRLQLKGDDLEGSAWFDDLQWREETRISVEDLSHSGFLVPEGGDVRLRVSCQDLEDGDYEIRMWAREYDGREIPVEASAIDAAAAPPKWRLRIGAGDPIASMRTHVPRTRVLAFEATVEGMPTGFVELVFAFRREGVEVARRRLGLVSLPERFSRWPSTSEWGVELYPFTPPDLIDRLGRLHLGRARVLLWSGSPEREEEMERNGEMDDILYRLTRTGHQISGSLATPPQELLPEGSTAFGMTQFLAGPEVAWRPALSKTFSRFRETIQEWRLGEKALFEGRQDLDALAKQIQDALKSDLPNVTVTFPLPIDDAASAAAQLDKPTGLRGLDLYLPGDMEAEAAKPLLGALGKRADAVSVTLGVEELAKGDATASFPVEAADLWRKAGLATDAEVRRIIVTPLVSYRAGLFDLEGTPTPLYASLGALHSALGDAAVSHMTPPFLNQDLEQIVFRHNDDTMILVWRKTPGPPAREALYLGDHVKVLRVDGRATLLTPDADGATRVAFTGEPVLLYDIDTPLFDTLQRVTFQPGDADSAGKEPQARLQPGEVLSMSKEQRIRLEIQNKFPSDLVVKGIAIDFPPYWKSKELRQDKVAPDKFYEQVVPITLPQSQTLGDAPVGVRLTLDAGGKTYSNLLVKRQLKVISVTGVELEVKARWTGDVLNLDVDVKNGREPASYVVYVGLGEGIPVQSDVTPTIQKDAPWRKTYAFANMLGLQGKVVRVKLDQPGGTTFLSRTTEVPYQSR